MSLLVKDCADTAVVNGSLRVNSDKLQLRVGGAWVDTAVGTLTTAPTTHTVSGTTIVLNAHETQNFGDVCYIAADGQAQLINASTIAGMPAVVMATGTINANADGTYLLVGIASDASWAWAVGGLIFGTVTGTTGNTLSQAAPAGANNAIQVIGVATHATRMIFNPQLVVVEHT
jgi:hypothetical protein